MASDVLERQLSRREKAPSCAGVAPPEVKASGDAQPLADLAAGTRAAGGGGPLADAGGGG
eukprot:scaffold12871_cov76-Phaeocystis_antarctica.AAC.10